LVLDTVNKNLSDLDSDSIGSRYDPGLGPILWTLQARQTRSEKNITCSLSRTLTLSVTPTSKACDSLRFGRPKSSFRAWANLTNQCGSTYRSQWTEIESTVFKSALNKFSADTSYDRHSFEKLDLVVLSAGSFQRKKETKQNKRKEEMCFIYCMDQPESPSTISID
jgi:hypothetical protein